MIKRILFLLLFSFPLSFVVGQVNFYSEDNYLQERAKDNFLGVLIDKGFQNLAATIEDSIFYLTVENRLYRDEIDALKAIIKEFPVNTYSHFEDLHITLQNRGIPTVSTQFSSLSSSDSILNTKSYFFNPKWSTIALEREWRKRFKNKIANTGNYRIEIEVEPQLRLILGAKKDPIIHQLNLLPSLNLYLWRGAKLRLQSIIPIWDEFDVAKEDLVRPGLLTFSQYIPLPKQFLLRASLGYFTQYRYGGELELNKFLGRKGNLLLQARVGYTGFASFPKFHLLEEPEKGWQFSNISYLTYAFAIEGRIPTWDMRTRVSWQKNLLNKKVLRAEVWRQFDELQVGFFVYRYEDKQNYGFSLAIPIFPKKYRKPNWVQLRSSKYFRYTYHTTLNFAPIYSTGEDIWDFYKNVTPDFINNQLVE